jgi:hypothetical protein
VAAETFATSASLSKAKMKRVLANIDADCGDREWRGLAWHGMRSLRH